MDNSLNVMRFGLADEAFGIDMAWVEGVEGAERVRREPLPDGALGRLPASVSDVPVYALASLLPGGSRTPARGQKVIVLRSGATAWGLLVGRTTQARRIETSALYALPRGVVDPETTPWDGVTRLDDDIVLMVAPERLRPGGDVASAPRTTWTEGASALPPPAEGGRLVLFTVGDEEEGKRRLSFGLSITQVAEVAEALRLAPVPGAAAHVAGLAWWRDRPLAVFDLARRAGLPPAPRDDRARLLVARTSAADVIGLLIRPSVRVLPTPLPHLPTARPLPLDTSAVLLSVELKGETLVVPDLAALVA